MKCLLIIENTDYSGVFSLPVTFRFTHILDKKHEYRNMNCLVHFLIRLSQFINKTY